MAKKPAKSIAPVQYEHDAEIQDIINTILSKTVMGRKFLFHGMPLALDRYDDQGYPLEKPRVDFLSSALYRNHGNLPFNNDFLPVHLEKEVITQMQHGLPKGMSNASCLRAIHDAGGETSLITFSYNLFTALYNACHGSYEHDGQLVILAEDGFICTKDISYEGVKSWQNMLIKTDDHDMRLNKDSLAYIHAPKGFITVKASEKFKIRRTLKLRILRYLRNVHHISLETMMTDLKELVQHYESQSEACQHYYRAIAAEKRDDFSAAIKALDKAITLYPMDTRYHMRRADINTAIGNHKAAIDDLTVSIDLNSSMKEAYIKRGVAKTKVNRHEAAILDFDHSLRLDPNCRKAKLYKEAAQAKLEKH